MFIGDTSTKTHYDALNVVTGGVFATPMEEASFYENYKGLVQIWAKYVKKCQVDSGVIVRVWWRLYFTEEGKIEGAIFSIKNQESLSDTTLALLQKQFLLFMEKERFPMTAKKKYAQCGPVSVRIE